jgi:hypothetical protein
MKSVHISTPMTIAQPLSPRQAREVLHLALLRELTTKLEAEHWSVKGGVNLRVYFGSVRYSEDIDLDVVPFKRQAVKKYLREALKPGSRFARRLREYGIQEIRIEEKEISKDSETTLRFKRQLVVGGVPHSTTVEVSFRSPRDGDSPQVAPVHPMVTAQYGSWFAGLVAVHYPRDSAISQKLDALANRRAVQARDVFDICWLLRDPVSDDALGRIARRLGSTNLKRAGARAQEIPFDEYRDRVLEYLDPADASPYTGEEAWLEQQVTVIALCIRLVAMIERDPENGIANENPSGGGKDA